MNALRRLAVFGILAASCSSLDPMQPEIEPYRCTPHAPDTVVNVWPRSFVLPLGAADRLWIDRAVDDGCSWTPLSLSDLSAVVQDPSVASAEVQPSEQGVLVAPRLPGSTSILIEGADLRVSIQVSVPDTSVLTNVVDLDAAGSHTCALEASRRILCWGDNYSELLGSNVEPGVGRCFGSPCSPMPIPLAWDAESVFLGQNLDCFVDASGTTCRQGGRVDLFAGLNFVSLSSRESHSCGVADDGEAYCWGSNYMGQLGTGGIGVDAGSPRPVASSGQTWVSVETRWDSTCGATDAGHLYCWGRLPDGAPLADECYMPGGKGSSGTYVSCSGTPVRIGVGFGADADTLVARVAGGCLLTTAGSVLCAPEGTTRFRRLSGGGPWEQLEAGASHYCALTAAGAASCWGDNYLGQLGTGGSSSSTTPVPVAGGLSFVDLALGGAHSCGLTVDGVVWCWGANDVGQAGGSILETPRVPAQVRGQGAP